MKILNDEAKILKIIYEGYGKLDIFTIFKRVKLPLFQLNKYINSLAKKEYVIIDEFSIRITKEAIEWIHSIEGKKMLTNNKDWKKTPDDFLGNKIIINDFYTPNYNLFK